MQVTSEEDNDDEERAMGDEHDGLALLA